MPTGSADPRRELIDAAKLVSATKLPLLAVLWLFVATTRFADGPFATYGPLALRVLSRWEARAYLLAACSPWDASNPFDGKPFAALFPLPVVLWQALSWCASAIHVDPAIAAVIVNLLLLVPAVASVRASMRGRFTPVAVNLTSILLLLGPGCWFLTTPGDHVLLLLAVGLALFGIAEHRPSVAAVGAAIGALSHPAGILLTASFLLEARRRRAFLLVALVPAAATGAIVAGFLHAGFGIDLALASWQRIVHVPPGEWERLSVAFSTGGGLYRSLDVHALLSAVVVALGALLSFRSTLAAPERALAIGGLAFVLRDFRDAPSVAAWCAPVAFAWSSVLARRTVPYALPLVAALGILPVLVRVNGTAIDWVAIGPAPTISAGETASAAFQNGHLGRPTEPIVRLADDQGTMQKFEFGYVFCSLAHGCRALDGQAALRYDEAGGRAACGRPMRDPVASDADGTLEYALERGSIRVKPWVYSSARCQGGSSWSGPGAAPAPE